MRSSTDSTPKPNGEPVQKKLLFINKIMRDGIGDLGHLIDIANPEAIKKNFPNPDSEGNAVNYQPVYIIIMHHPTPERVRHLIRTLKINKIIKDDNNPYDLSLDGQVQHYLDHVLHANPQLFLAPSYQNNKFEGDHKDDLILPYKRVSEIIEDMYDSVEVHDDEEEGIAKNNTAALFAISVIDREVADLIRNLSRKNLISCTQIHEHGRNFGKQGTLPTLLDYVYTMGFYPRNSGVLLKDKPILTLEEKANSLIAMHNKEFIQELMEIKEDGGINLNQAKDFLTSTLLIAGYFQSSEGNNFFIEALAISEKAKEYNNIIFYVNNKNFINRLDNTLLQEYGFKEIIIHRDEKNTIPLAGDGKRRLQIFTSASHYLDDIDYSTLYQLSSFFGGCSGDKTLEQTLSSHLIPFYDQPRTEKAVLESLILLAQQYLPNPAIIVNYLNILLNFKLVYYTDERTKMTQNMGKLINDAFIKDWEYLLQKIHENHNLTKRLPAIMADAFRVHDFCIYHLKDFDSYLEKKQYAVALALLNQSKLQFPDLMTLVDALYHKGHEQSAAFIFSFISNTNLLNQEHLDRTPEEIKKSKLLRIFPESFNRYDGDELESLSLQYGFNTIDFNKLQETILLNQSQAEDQSKHDTVQRGNSRSIWKPALQSKEGGETPDNKSDDLPTNNAQDKNSIMTSSPKLKK